LYLVSVLRIFLVSRCKRPPNFRSNIQQASDRLWRGSSSLKSLFSPLDSIRHRVCVAKWSCQDLTSIQIQPYLFRALVARGGEAHRTEAAARLRVGPNANQKNSPPMWRRVGIRLLLGGYGTPHSPLFKGEYGEGHVTPPKGGKTRSLLIDTSYTSSWAGYSGDSMANTRETDLHRELFAHFHRRCLVRQTDHHHLVFSGSQPRRRRLSRSFCWSVRVSVHAHPLQPAKQSSTHRQ